jgi:hypothetical protein
MWELKNRTAYAADRAWVRDRSGAHRWIVAVKATFDIEPDGALALADEQRPLLLAPEHHGQPGASSVRYKPFNDAAVNRCLRQLDPSKSVSRDGFFDSGYASLALVHPYNMDLKGAGEMFAPLAFRHPGYDVPENDATCDKVGGLCRGARWVTLLGPTQTAALGGCDGIERGLAPGLTATPLAEGVMIQAGERPELGDVNRGEDVPLLRALARQLEPVTLFGDTFLQSLLGARFEDRERRLL